VDWNGDGKKDLITGERNGTVRIYLNNNTDADPVFSTYSFLKVGSSNYDIGLNSHPYIIDWDNDGLFDLIMGEDAGKVALLINTGTATAPQFDTAVWIKNGTSNLVTSNESSPTAVDWDRDGKKDLVVGDYNGNLNFFKNIGTDADPVFNGKKQMAAGGKKIDVQYYARIDVFDWNNDGVVDLFSGYRDYNASFHSVWFFEAKGPLSADKNALSETTGGTISFNLDAGIANANRKYILIGTATGHEPGTPLPGGNVVLPINWSPATDLILSLVNSSLFSNFMGTLNASGVASPRMTLGALPGLAGLHLTFAGALKGPWDYVTNPLYIEITP